MYQLCPKHDGVVPECISCMFCQAIARSACFEYARSSEGCLLGASVVNRERASKGLNGRAKGIITTLAFKDI